ncbi:MAG: hypothetical protein IKY31_00105 [Bacteroidaceae bacterium]|nr:hypothetical protein [Bacteroidaceae bacterium]
MEKMEIKKIVRRLWVDYLVVWALALAIVVLYETGVMEEGLLAHNGSLCYVLQTATILLALLAIPASLKMFSMVLNKRIVGRPLSEALASYLRWSEVRLALLAIVALVGLSVYYTTLSSIGGLCALIGLIASFFCLPNEKRMAEELNQEEDKE